MKNQDVGHGCGILLAVVVGTVTSLVALLWLVLVVKERYEYHYGFDRQRWMHIGQVLRATHKESTVDMDESRRRMVEDVMAHHLRAGMSRPQVLTLLGPPEKEGIEWSVPANAAIPDAPTLDSKKGTDDWNKWFAHYAQPDTLMVYQIGWGIMDPTYLRIEFSGRGRVRKFWFGYR